MTSLYDPVLMRHARAPARRGRVDAPTHEADGKNRPCGDYVVVTLATSPDGATITAARFEGEGCALTMASASALCDAIEGQPIAGARAAAEALITSMTSEPGKLPGDLSLLAAARAFPGRHGCVILPASLVLTALEPHERNAKDP